MAHITETGFETVEVAAKVLNEKSKNAAIVLGKV